MVIMPARTIQSIMLLTFTLVYFMSCYAVWLSHFSSPFSNFAERINNKNKILRENNKKMLLTHFVTYWTVSMMLMLKNGEFILPNNNTVKRVLFNQIFINTALFYVCPMSTNNNEEFFYFCKTFPLVVIIQNFVFYWLHRLFHKPFFYPIHMIHHTWIDTLPYSAIDCHPLEHGIVNMLPILIGPYILGWGYTFINIWVTIATVSTLWAHSKSLTNHHAVHHRHKNCNFGSFWTDVLFSTIKIEN